MDRIHSYSNIVNDQQLLKRITTLFPSNYKVINIETFYTDDGLVDMVGDVFYNENTWCILSLKNNKTHSWRKDSATYYTCNKCGLFKKEIGSIVINKETVWISISEYDCDCNGYFCIKDIIL